MKYPPYLLFNLFLLLSSSSFQYLVKRHLFLNFPDSNYIPSRKRFFPEILLFSSLPLFIHFSVLQRNFLYYIPPWYALTCSGLNIHVSLFFQINSLISSLFFFSLIASLPMYLSYCLWLPLWNASSPIPLLYTFFPLPISYFIRFAHLLTNLAPYFRVMIISIVSLAFALHYSFS